AEYVAKLDHLLSCRRDAAAHPGEVELVFLSEMGYQRWPAEGGSWSQLAPAPAPLADRDGPNNKQWRVSWARDVLLPDDQEMQAKARTGLSRHDGAMPHRCDSTPSAVRRGSGVAGWLAL